MRSCRGPFAPLYTFPPSCNIRLGMQPTLKSMPFFGTGWDASSASPTNTHLQTSAWMDLMKAEVNIFLELIREWIWCRFKKNCCADFDFCFHHMLRLSFYQFYSCSHQHLLFSFGIRHCRSLGYDYYRYMGKGHHESPKNIRLGIRAWHIHSLDAQSVEAPG